MHSQHIFLTRLPPPKPTQGNLPKPRVDPPVRMDSRSDTSGQVATTGPGPRSCPRRAMSIPFGGRTVYLIIDMSTIPMPTPLIAVSADVRDVDGYRWHAAPDTYLKAVVAGLGGLPVIVPSLAGGIDLDTLLDRVDGVLVTGSRSNVYPGEYGAAPTPEAEPYDRDRDAMVLPLIRAAIARGVPLFAICRGMQELNVALGGTLVAEVHKLPGRADHYAPASEPQQTSASPSARMSPSPRPGRSPPSSRRPPCG